MNSVAALLRGINVGGKNRLKMNELTAVLASLNLQNIKTYIQSGNAVFATERDDLPALAAEIAAAIAVTHGFIPEVMLLKSEELDAAVNAAPFEAEPKTLHFYFLASEPPAPDLAKLESLRAGRERFELKGKVFYLHAPDGIGRSKLAAGAEKALSVRATARNARTVAKLRDLF